MNNQVAMLGPKERHQPVHRRRRWLLALLLLTAAGAGIATVYLTAPRPPLSDLEGVDPAIAKAIARRERLVRLLPRSGTAWGRLATTFYMHHFNGQADVAFAMAERLSPRNPRWPYLRGLSMAEEDMDKALPMLRRAASLVGDGPAAPRLRFAELALERGHLDEAEAHLAHVLKREPENARALLNMGRLEFTRGRLAESRSFLERSLQHAPGVKASRMLLATVLQRLGETGASAQELRAASSLPEKTFWPDPFRQEALAFWVGKDALFTRADDAILQQDFAQARELFQRAVREYPSEARSWIGLGKVQRSLGDRASATNSLQKALALAPDSLVAHIELGGVFYDEKQFAEAERHFRKSIQLKPELSEAWHNLGLSLTAQQKPDEAVEAFERALSLKPSSAPSYTFLGQALAMTGQLSAAMAKLDRALELSPDDSSALTLRNQVRTAMNPHGPQ
ncbi:MAG: tetratricopeptide repeat protein [Verrucomicrobiales bacterium]